VAGLVTLRGLLHFEKDLRRILVYVPPILLAFVPGRASSCWPVLKQKTHLFSEIRLSSCYNSYLFHRLLVRKDVEAARTVEYP
jgi:hypothetical protein